MVNYPVGEEFKDEKDTIYVLRHFWDKKYIKEAQVCVTENYLVIKIGPKVMFCELEMIEKENREAEKEIKGDFTKRKEDQGILENFLLF